MPKIIQLGKFDDNCYILSEKEYAKAKTAGKTYSFVEINSTENTKTFECSISGVVAGSCNDEPEIFYNSDGIIYLTLEEQGIKDILE